MIAVATTGTLRNPLLRATILSNILLNIAEKTLAHTERSFKKISADILSLSDKLGGGVAFYKQMRKYAEDLAEKSNVVSMAIYDCFEGEVKILEETEEKVYIEVIDVLPCYSCQKTPECGERFWIEKSLIYHPVYNTSPSSGDDVPY